MKISKKEKERTLIPFTISFPITVNPTPSTRKKNNYHNKETVTTITNMSTVTASTTNIKSPYNETILN